ncbi:MAG: 3-methyl-2-oxobutanoate hydroxymethyltransferase [Clostridia bacterium]|nr:3-methyl-2-oxobutanoate hydroxymethyltransferase [Clostridia bacterium]
MKNTTATFAQMKKNGEKISMLTAYDYSTARLVDSAGVNSILVGDSLGMVMLGYPDSTRVTMEDMLHHVKAVVRGVQNALVVADMPFMSYQTSVYDAVKNAGRLIQEGGAGCVKLEGGVDIYEQIEAIVKAGIPVCGHVGLTPQSINAFGGFKVQGKTLETAKKIIEDAKAVEKAGAFAIVLEGIPAPLADIITKQITIPTIGIGASNSCDGQVLVYQDMLGLYSNFTPKFVKKFANIGDAMTEAFKKYDEEVKNGSFPTEEYTYKMDENVLKEIEAYLK